MRRWSIWVVILVILFNINTTVCASSSDEWKNIIQYSSSGMMYAPDGDGVWLVSDGIVYRWDRGADELREIKKLHNVEHIASINGELIVQAADTLSRINGMGDEKSIGRFNEGGTAVVRQIDGMSGDVLVLLGERYYLDDEEEHDHAQETHSSVRGSELLRIDVETGEVTGTKKIPYDASSMAVDEQGIVYICASDAERGTLLLAIDFEKDGEATLYSLSRYGDVVYIAVSSDGGRVFFASRGYLYALNTQTQAIRNTGILMPESSLGIRRGGEMLYTGEYYDEAFVLSALVVPDMPQSERKLRIFNCKYNVHNTLSIALSEFENRNPDVELLLLYRNAEAIITSQMAGENDMDILCFSTSGGRDVVRLENIASAGLLLDLNTVPGLDEAYAGWASMPRLTHFDGQWITVPTDVSPQAWLVNSALAEELNITIPEGKWDWEQFLEIAREVNEKSGGEAHALLDIIPTSVMEAFIRDNSLNFEEMTASFTSANTRRALEIWDECVQMGYIQKSEGTSEIEYAYEGIPYPPDVLFIAIDQYSNRAGDKTVCLPPSLGDMDGVPSHVSSMSVLANGENRDIAIDFLRLFASDEIQGSLIYVEAEVFLKDQGKYLDFSEHLPAMLFEDIRQYIETVTASPRNHGIWIELLGNALRRQDSADDIDRENTQAFKAFEERKIGIDEYLHRMQTIADMVMGE